MAEQVHLIGTGGLGKELIGYLNAPGSLYEVVGAWGDEPFNNESFAKYYRGDLARARAELGPRDKVFLAVAHPKAKRMVLEAMGGVEALDWQTYVHPFAVLSPFARIGTGVILTPYAIVAGDAELGNFVFFNSGAATGHDTTIESMTTLFPNSEVCGDCFIGEGSILGIGAYVVPGVSLPAGTRVQAGALVWESPGRAGLLVGNPAKLSE